MRKILLPAHLLLLGLLIAACYREPSYETVARRELSRNERFDTLIYEIHFGMVFEDFYDYCYEMNQKGIFMPKPDESGVRALLTEPFNAPVVLEFFPVAQVTDGPIVRLNATLRYQNFSFYDQRYAIENLVREAMQYFEQEYGGRDFIAVPQKNKLVKNYFVKLDGNRRVTLMPSPDGAELKVIFEDLSRLINPMPLGIAQ